MTKPREVTLVFKRLNYITTTKPKRFEDALAKVFKKYAIGDDWEFNFEEEEV
jgi:hypothetical protein